MTGTLRVWHAPNSKDGFTVPVSSVEEAVAVIRALCAYDLFLDGVIGKGAIVASASGLEVLVDGEWEEWEDEEGQYDVLSLMDEEEV